MDEIYMPLELWMIVFSKMKKENVINLGLASMNIWNQAVSKWIYANQPEITMRIFTNNESITKQVVIDVVTRKPAINGRFIQIPNETLLMGPFPAIEYVLNKKLYHFGKHLLERGFVRPFYIFWMGVLSNDAVWLGMALSRLNKNEVPTLFRVSMIHNNVTAVQALAGRFGTPKLEPQLNEEDWLCLFFSGNRNIIRASRQMMKKMFNKEKRSMMFAVTLYDLESLTLMQEFLHSDNIDWLKEFLAVLLTNDQQKINWYWESPQIEHKRQEVTFEISINREHILEFCIKNRLECALQLLDEERLSYDDLPCLIAVHAINDDQVLGWAQTHCLLPSCVDWVCDDESLSSKEGVYIKMWREMIKNVSRRIGYSEPELFVNEIIGLMYTVHVPTSLSRWTPEAPCVCQCLLTTFIDLKVPVDVINGIHSRNLMMCSRSNENCVVYRHILDQHT